MRSVLVAVLGLALTACGGPAGPSASAEGIGAIVLVSGRDDHGLLQMARVPLYAEPEGREPVATMPDGDFAQVVEISGTWLRIRSVAEPPVTGWIDDFHLRDRAVLHDTQQVTFVAAQPGDPIRIEVQLVNDDGPSFWVEADHLAEVGAELEPHDH